MNDPMLAAAARSVAPAVAGAVVALAALGRPWRRAAGWTADTAPAIAVAAGFVLADLVLRSWDFAGLWPADPVRRLPIVAAGGAVVAAATAHPGVARGIGRAGVMAARAVAAAAAVWLLTSAERRNEWAAWQDWAFPVGLCGGLILALSAAAGAAGRPPRDAASSPGSAALRLSTSAAISLCAVAASVLLLITASSLLSLLAAAVSASVGVVAASAALQRGAGRAPAAAWTATLVLESLLLCGLIYNSNNPPAGPFALLAAGPAMPWLVERITPRRWGPWRRLLATAGLISALGVGAIAWASAAMAGPSGGDEDLESLYGSG